MLRILHVEDDPDVQEICKLLFEASGDIELIQCATGLAALDVIARDAVDVVLLDAMLGGMDGLATLKEIRLLERGADVPVIFMTGRARGHEIAAFMAAGAIGVITKPFDPLQLDSEIRRLLSEGGSRPVESVRSSV